MPDPKYPAVPSPEFLAELVERARRYGWSGDYVEVCYFIESLYPEGIEPPNLTPYEDLGGNVTNA